MHGGGRFSNPFVRSLGARVTAGLRTPDAEYLDLWLPYVCFQPEILRYLEVASLVGARPVGLEPRLQPVPADLSEADRTCPDDGRPLVAVHPGAGGAMRRWPTDKFARVADVLVRAGARVAVVGGREEEKALVEEVIGDMREPALNPWGSLSLGGLWVCCRAALCS